MQHKDGVGSYSDLNFCYELKTRMVKPQSTINLEKGPLRSKEIKGTLGVTISIIGTDEEKFALLPPCSTEIKLDSTYKCTV